MNSVSSQDFFGNFSALTDLKTKAKKDPDAALKEVAQKFEAIFINMLLKNMRTSSESIGGGLFSSSQTKQYQGMMDTQMSQSLSKTGGFGIANALMREYQGKGSHSAKDSSDSELLSRVSQQDLVKVQTLAHKASTDFIQAVQQEVAKKASVDSMNNNLAIGEGEKSEKPSALSVAFDSPESFVKALWPHAKEAAEKLGVNPKAILAQAVLETGWGKYPIAKEDGTASFNLFGIKADSRWQGERAVVNTLEYRDGIAKREKAAFRAYDSFSQSFNDYAEFLTSSDRYKDALNSGKDSSMFASLLQKGGYATDPEYSNKINHILSSKWFKSL
ncbi:MAG: flagellar assembly peptidoglycan hydrolase FlgJ [Marinomonas sp.]